MPQKDSRQLACENGYGRMKGTETFVKIRPASVARIIAGRLLMRYSIGLAFEADLRT